MRGLLRWRPRIGSLQVDDQTLEYFLIEVVILPVAEVGDEILANLAGGIFLVLN